MYDKIIKQTDLKKETPATFCNIDWKPLFEDINKYNDIQIRNILKSFLMQEGK